MLDFQCPYCQTILHIPEQFVGSTGTCRNCRKSITIEVKPESHTGDTPLLTVRPTLVVFHAEMTGPTSRQDNIIELAAIKIDGTGRQLDTFWSLANPDAQIAEKIIERTNITNDMVAQSPFSFEVVKDWFDWIGPNAILLADHAHFHSKFVCATMYREDMLPGEAHIIDVVHWAEDLDVPTQEYKFRPLLDALGYSGPRTHRAMDSCQGVLAIVQHLLKLELGRLPRQAEVGVLGKLLGKKNAPEVDDRLYLKLNSIAATLSDMCGRNFYARDKYEDRVQRRERGGNGHSEAADSQAKGHMPEWYGERKRLLNSFRNSGQTQDDTPRDIGPNDGPWTEALMAATQCHDQEEQRTHLMKAISLQARDPWPYERLTGFFIRARDYESAQRICEKYFEGEVWKTPRFAESSLKILHKMEKLEQKLAEAP